MSEFLIKKERSISHIHALWMKSTERHEKNKAKILDILDKIKTVIKPEINGSYILYANNMFWYKNTYNQSDVIRYNYSDHGYSHTRLNKHDIDNDRKLKIAIINNHESLILGNELYYYSEYMRSNMNFRLFNYLFKKIKDKLKKELENSSDNTDYNIDSRIVCVKFDNYEYLIKVHFKRQYKLSYVYYEFEWIGENKIDIYNL